MKKLIRIVQWKLYFFLYYKKVFWTCNKNYKNQNLSKNDLTYKKNRNKISKEKQKAICQNGGIFLLVTTKEMFKKSMEEHFAVGAFNVNNM